MILSNESVGINPPDETKLILRFNELNILTSEIFNNKNIIKLNMEYKIKWINSKRAYNLSMNILDSPQSSDKERYTQIYRSIIKYINGKTGKNKVEYSIDEILQIIGKFIDKKHIEEFKEILKRVQEIRFSPISSQKINKDIMQTKLLLKLIDNEWK